MRPQIKHAVTLLVWLCVLWIPARGQNRGVIRGTVEDSSGAAVAGAEVKLNNTATGEKSSITSDEDGYFAFNNLALGSYFLVVNAPGFAEAQRSILLEGSAVPPMRIRLKLAPVEQGIKVTAQAAPSAEQNTDFVELNQKWLQTLPVKQGDPLAVPSLFLDPAAAGAEGPKLIVDGVESSSLEIPTTSIKEVYVNRSPYSSEFSRPGKGRIEVITRRGSHQRYRAVVSLLVRNSALDARNAFATFRPPLQRDFLETQLSGPIGSNLTFLIAGRYGVNNDTAVVNADTPAGLLQENFSTRSRDSHLFGRLDFALSPRNKVTVAYKFKNKSQRNRGVGGFNLPERATNNLDRENEVKIFETATVSDQFLNEARFTFKVQTLHTSSVTNQPAIIVLDAFSGGGAQIAQQRRETVSNFQDIATRIVGKHALRFGAGFRPRFFDTVDASNFGGTFTFSSLAKFAAASPFRFAINQGNPAVSYTQHEFFAFLQDEIALRPNLSVALGLRYEVQSHLSHYANLGPRFSLAYSPGNGQTVIRAGAGVFYDRLPEVMQQQALLFNGSGIRQMVVSRPGFPNPLAPGSVVLPPSTVVIAPDIRASYLMQASVGVERKLGKGRNYLALDYTTLRGVGLFRMRNVNAPFPGTLIRPNPSLGNIDQFESSGTSRSNALTVTLQTAWGRKLSLLAQYRLSRSLDDTNGMFSLPADNYDLRGEWGRSDFDQRHRFNLAGVYQLPWGLKAGSILNLYSGIPFNIITGVDNNHDTVANDRPPGISRNMGHGPGYANLDLHLSKEIKLQRKNHSPKLEIGLDAFNAFNHVSFQNFIGTLTSPFFGRANAAKPARELQLSLKLDF